MLVEAKLAMTGYLIDFNGPRLIIKQTSYIWVEIHWELRCRRILYYTCAAQKDYRLGLYYGKNSTRIW